MTRGVYAQAWEKRNARETRDAGNSGGGGDGDGGAHARALARRTPARPPTARVAHLALTLEGRLARRAAHKKTAAARRAHQRA